MFRRKKRKRTTVNELNATLVDAFNLATANAVPYDREAFLRVLLVTRKHNETNNEFRDRVTGVIDAQLEYRKE